jgi:hypothetical protein
VNADYDFVKEDYKEDGELDGKVVGKNYFILRVSF